MSRRVINLNKIIRKLFRFYIGILSNIDHDIYMRSYIKFLRANGMKIGDPIYIGNTTRFDGTDYSLITIEDGVVISSEVLFLTHDYSISRAAVACGYELIKEFPIIGTIKVERNSFIGVRATVLPNTVICHDSIIGAGAVVKGIVEPYSIMIGNPARKIGDVREWFEGKTVTNTDYKRYIRCKKF